MDCGELSNGIGIHRFGFRLPLFGLIFQLQGCASALSAGKRKPEARVTLVIYVAITGVGRVEA